jgi:predicted PurR-regulated permease PerM
MRGVLYYAREALEPIIIAAFIACLIHPAVTVLTHKTRLKRSDASTWFISPPCPR